MVRRSREPTLFTYTTLFRSSTRTDRLTPVTEPAGGPCRDPGPESRKEPHLSSIQCGPIQIPARHGVRAKIGRAHVCTPVTVKYRMPSTAGKNSCTHLLPIDR